MITDVILIEIASGALSVVSWLVLNHFKISAHVIISGNL